MDGGVSIGMDGMGVCAPDPCVALPLSSHWVRANGLPRSTFGGLLFMPALFVLGMVSLEGAARAMDITQVPTASGGPPILSLRGEIVDGDFDQLAEELIAVRSRQGLPLLALDSPGGNIIEADNMGSLIRRLGLSVVVSDGEECASACFLLFAAALHRAAAPGAKIGVHSASLFGDENLLTEGVTTLMARDAAMLGVPPSVLGRMITTIPSDMAWLTDDELRQMNVRREGLPAPQQYPEPRLVAGVNLLTRPDVATAALPGRREIGPDPAGSTVALAYRAGDAGIRASPSPSHSWSTAVATITLTGSTAPAYVTNGPAISAIPQYVPGT